MNLGWLETSFPVADAGHTAAWYQKLGFRVVDSIEDGRCITLEAGECRLALYQGFLDPAQPQLIFWNGDVEAYAEKLVAAGAEILRQPTFAADQDARGLVKRANGDVSLMVRDPDGQPVYLVRMAEAARTTTPAPATDLDRGFFQVDLPVKDPNRTADFYELLGFRRSAVDDKEGANIDPRVVALTNGECRICLYQGYLDPDELQLNFWQGDIEAVAAVAQRDGLSILRQGRDDAGAAVMLIDPDGRPNFFINMHKYTAANFVSESSEMLA